MSYSTIQVRIKGISPLMCHNGQLADPTNQYAREIKKLASKGSKKLTDEDRVEIARLEFLGGLYIGDDGGPCIPGECVEAMVISGAKKARKGMQAQAGVFSDGNWPIIYKGTRKPDAMWTSGSFHRTCGAGINNATVMRTRPIFREWELAFHLTIMPDVISVADVKDALTEAGRIVGLCDWRPKHGRFEVTEFEVK